MPQRFLKPGITNSDKWNSVPFAAQSLYIRLITLVDDYGRCDGRPALILGQCFSIWNANNPDDTIDLQQVSEMLQQLAATSLIQFYGADSKVVIQINQWTERLREGVKERFPTRELQQIPADSCKILPSSSSSPTPSSPSSTIYISATSGYRPSLREIEDVYAVYPKKKARQDALRAIARALKKEGMEKVMEATRKMAEAWKNESDLKFCPHAATWYNGGRYLDPAESYLPTSPFKPNPRNAGLATNTVEQGKAVAALIAKRNGAAHPQPELGGIVP